MLITLLSIPPQKRHWTQRKIRPPTAPVPPELAGGIPHVAASDQGPITQWGVQKWAHHRRGSHTMPPRDKRRSQGTLKHLLERLEGQVPHSVIQSAYEVRDLCMALSPRRTPGLGAKWRVQKQRHITAKGAEGPVLPCTPTRLCGAGHPRPKGEPCQGHSHGPTDLQVRLWTVLWTHSAREQKVKRGVAMLSEDAVTSRRPPRGPGEVCVDTSWPTGLHACAIPSWHLLQVRTGPLTDLQHSVC